MINLIEHKDYKKHPSEDAYEWDIPHYEVQLKFGEDYCFFSAIRFTEEETVESMYIEFNKSEMAVYTFINHAITFFKARNNESRNQG